MEKLYKMNLNFGRQGSLEGVFIADSEKVRILIEKEIEVDFGEVLGKNSDVSTTINEDEIVELSSIIRTMTTILEALENAKINLDNITKVPHLTTALLPLIKVQLNNSIVLLNKGYNIDTEIDPLLEKYGNVDNVPDAGDFR